MVRPMRRRRAPEMAARQIARRASMRDKPCGRCGSPVVIVDPETNPKLGWCLCGEDNRVATGQPMLFEVLAALGDDDAAHEVLDNPFEPPSDAEIERVEAMRARTRRELRQELDARFLR